MQDNYTTKGKHLTIDSRRLIERWKKEGKSNREVASLLGKAPQTIHTEIKLDQGTKGKDSPLYITKNFCLK
ncbi:transposase [Streptococcus pneumoniae]|nr:transposase [Streptococcus pneumoniae]